MTTAAGTPPRKRVLLSAFACSPLWGSEPGVGWRWALELGRRHDVTVLTHAYFRDQIKPLQERGETPGVTFEWLRVPGIGGHPHRQLNSRLYYWLWQWAARARVRLLMRTAPHDLIHHLTWGTYRLPSFLGGLGVPLAVGPVGGGESAPLRLYGRWPWRERAFYLVRQASILCSRWDPFVLWSMAHTQCVLTKTRETRAALPWFARARAAEASEIGVAHAAARSADRRVREPPARLRLLYAGRLLGGKGISYVLDMVAVLAGQGVRVDLDVAGDGRLAAWSKGRIATLGIGDRVNLLGQVARERMTALYDAADLLVFPSWHDSSGNVVTEALARGVPVLCLDIGGPRYAVDDSCAVIVATTGRDEHGLAEAMAAGVAGLDRDRQRLAQLSLGATARARDMTWSSQVDRAYAIIDAHTGWRHVPVVPRP